MKVLFLLLLVIFTVQNSTTFAEEMHFASNSFGSVGLGLKKFIPTQGNIQEQVLVPNVGLSFGYIQEKKWKLSIGVEFDHLSLLKETENTDAFLYSVLHRNQFLWRLYYPFYLSVGASFKFSVLSLNEKSDFSKDSSYLFYTSPEVGITYFNHSGFFYSIQVAYNYNTVTNSFHYGTIYLSLGKLFNGN